MNTDKDLDIFKIHRALHNKLNADFIIKELDKNHKNINYLYAQDKDGITSLHLACKYKCVKVVHKLLKIGVDSNYSDNFGKSSLHYAIAVNSMDLVLLFISEGANINAPDKFGQTPLFYACQYKREMLILLLLQYGADIEYKNNKGETVLLQMCAARSGNFVEIIKLLIIMNANICVTNKYGKTVHQYAIENKLIGVFIMLASFKKYPETNEEVFEDIITNLNINFNHISEFSETFLHIICSNYNSKFLRLQKKLPSIPWNCRTLYNDIYQIDIENDDCLVKFEYETCNDAFAFNTYEIISVLVKKRAIDINAKNYLGETALHLLCTKTIAIEEFSKCVHFLVEHGADINITDNFQQTPLDYAKINNNTEYIYILSKYGTKNNIFNVICKRNVDCIEYMPYTKALIQLAVYTAVNSFNEKLLYLCIKYAMRCFHDIITFILKNVSIAGDFILSSLFYRPQKLFKTRSLCAYDVSMSMCRRSKFRPCYIKNKFYNMFYHIMYRSVECDYIHILKLLPEDDDANEMLTIMQLFLLIEISKHCYVEFNNSDDIFKNYFFNPLFLSSHKIRSTARTGTHFVRISFASILALCLMKTKNTYQYRLKKLCLISEYDNSSHFKELKTLDTIKFENTTTSVLQFLVADTNEAAVFVKNKNIVRQLLSTDFRIHTAPLFADVLKEKLWDALNRKSLLSNAPVKIRQLIPEKIKLDEIPLNLICNALKNNDLKKLID